MVSVVRIYKKSRCNKKMGGSGLKYFVDCKATPDDETCGFLVLNIKNKLINKNVLNKLFDFNSWNL